MCVVGGSGWQGNIALEARSVLLHKGFPVDVTRPQTLHEGGIRKGYVEGRGSVDERKRHDEKVIYVGKEVTDM